MPMLTPTGASNRIVLLASGSLGLTALAVEVASLAGGRGLAYALPACAALLLGAAVVLWDLGRRLTGALFTAEETAVRSRAELQAALDNMSQGLVLCDTEANIVAVNNRFLQLFGLFAHRVRPGMSVAQLIRLQAETGNWTAEHAEVLVHERLNRPPGASGRLVMPFPLGLLEVAYQPRPEGGWACTFEDVTAQKKAEERLAFLAQHDSLTGLPNRALLRERIDLAIAAGASFAVMLVDLDHFKLANDTFGHGVGDALLCAVASRLCAEMRDGDTVARLGGDEFAVLMSAPCARGDADRQAARLIQALAEPFQVEGRWLRIGASLGISLAAQASDRGAALDFEALLRQADLALYCVKADGRRAHRFYDRSMARAAIADSAAA